MRINRIVISAIIFMCLFGCGGCGHKHVWNAATCSVPKMCLDCGKTEGEPLAHDWTKATCTEPKKCKICLLTDGAALGHDWIEATCEDPRICDRCKKMDGEALGHSWTEATCTDSKTCNRCKKTDGEAKGHIFENNVCIESSVCSICGTIVGPLGHDVTKATCTKNGVCKRCGEILEYAGHDVDDTHKCRKCGQYEIIETADGLKISTEPVTKEGNVYQLLDAEVTKYRGNMKDVSFKFNFEHLYVTNTTQIRVLCYDENGNMLYDLDHIIATKDGINTYLIDFLPIEVCYFELMHERAD